MRFDICSAAGAWVPAAGLAAAEAHGADGAQLHAAAAAAGPADPRPATAHSGQSLGHGLMA